MFKKILRKNHLESKINLYRNSIVIWGKNIKRNTRALQTTSDNYKKRLTQGTVRDKSTESNVFVWRP